MGEAAAPEVEAPRVLFSPEYSDYYWGRRDIPSDDSQTEEEIEIEPQPEIHLLQNYY